MGRGEVFCVNALDFWFAYDYFVASEFVLLLWVWVHVGFILDLLVDGLGCFFVFFLVWRLCFVGAKGTLKVGVRFYGFCLS